MATPHLRNGVYYCRLAVPKDLRSIVGKAQVWRSLMTKDLEAAKTRFPATLAEIRDEWSALRVSAAVLEETKPSDPEPLPVRPLSTQEAHGLAGVLYRKMVEDNREEPGSPEQWTTKLRGLQAALPINARMPDGMVPFANQRFQQPAIAAVRMFSAAARQLASEAGFSLDPPGLTKLTAACALATSDAYNTLLRYARGDYRPDEKALRFPTLETLAETVRPPGIATEELLALWIKSSGLKPKTHKSWAGKLRMLMKFVEKTDVSHLEVSDIERWRDHRIDSGRSAKTVTNGDLAGVRGILEWAKEHTSVPSISVNVAEPVRLKRSKAALPAKGAKSLTLQEAETILRGTFVPVGENPTVTSAAARRWVPWLMAFSGARVGEIAQLTANNVVQSMTPDGRAIWCMKLTPDDGSIKTGEARIVPLHPQIIEQGFLEYVRSRAGKTLFYDLARSRGAEDPASQIDKVGQRLAEWIREDLKIVRKVQPNHGWRHRFETEGRRLQIRKDVINFITGHAQDDTAGEYGDYLVETLYDAICRFPRYLDPKP